MGSEKWKMLSKNKKKFSWNWFAVSWVFGKDRFKIFWSLYYAFNIRSNLSIRRLSSSASEAALVFSTVKLIPPPALWTSIYEAPANFIANSWTRSPAQTGWVCPSIKPVISSDEYYSKIVSSLLYSAIYNICSEIRLIWHLKIFSIREHY